MARTVRTIRWHSARAFLMASVVVVAPLAAVLGSAGRAVAASSPEYYLALGDSLAFGIGASSAAHGYVGDIYAHEAARTAGLQLENLGCPGETTVSMRYDATCRSVPQLAAAESFLRAHPGKVAFVTIDIGANDIVGCEQGTTISAPCIDAAIATIGANLPAILSGLEAASPGTPIYGMNYYDPFLALWALGGATWQGVAAATVPVLGQLNATLAKAYGAAGVPTADVAGAFQTTDFSLTGHYAGMTLPQNVANICNWTLMCTSADIHTNDVGHAVIAGAFEHWIDMPYTGIAATPDGSGYWLVKADGFVAARGDAATYGSMAGTVLNAPIAHIVATPDGRGYWLVAADGGTFAFGDAGFFGSMGGKRLNAPVVDLAPTADGRGYWLVAADGGIFAFGDARFHGSMGARPLNEPVVGIAADDRSGGYWEVARDGGIFAFDAPFYGSTGAIALNEPVNGMAATADDGGYWFVAADGGIFAYGDAHFHGSTGGLALTAPVVGMAADAATGGYWLLARDGGIFAFHAPFYGAG